jgi:choline dehydrogenase-like flavoprotein
VGLVAEDVLALVAANDDMRNLFIIDASVFVTSGGLTPALTIQANAFRVCDYLVRRRYGATSRKDRPRKVL